jgi:hypothetical protein
MRRSVALLLPLAVMIAGCGAAHHPSAETAPLTGYSSCVEWTHASELERSTFVEGLIQGGAVPAKYHGANGRSELEQEIIDSCLAAADGTTGRLLNEAVPQEITTTTATSSAQPTTSADSYPVVHYSSEHWPFTLQIIDFSEQVDGPESIGSAPPGHQWLLVRINVTLESPGRSADAPKLETGLQCSLPGGNTLDEREGGYEEPTGSGETVAAYNLGFASGESHVWVSYYEVAQGTKTTGVTCSIIEYNGNNVNTKPLT